MPRPSSSDPWQIDGQAYPTDAPLTERLQFLLQYAILAPSYQNTQPWKFDVTPDGVDVFVDRTRWLRVADHDQRELYISVGCALENLLVAIQHFKIGYELLDFPDPGFEDHVARIRIVENKAPAFFRPASLFEAILVRHTSHEKHNQRVVSDRHFELLKSCCADSNIHLHFSADPEVQRTVDDLLVRGNVMQFAEKGYRREVAHWIGQGALGDSWLMSKLGKLTHMHLNRGKTESQRDSELLMSSPAIGVICSTRDDRPAQVKSGQVYQRIGLLAAAMKIWLQPLSHIVEILGLREQLGELIPISDVVPQHVFRLGYGDQAAQHTPRRPLSEFLIEPR